MCLGVDYFCGKKSLGTVGENLRSSSGGKKSFAYLCVYFNKTKICGSSQNEETSRLRPLMC